MPIDDTDALVPEAQSGAPLLAGGSCVPGQCAVRAQRPIGDPDEDDDFGNGDEDDDEEDEDEDDEEPMRLSPLRAARRQPWRICTVR